MQMISIPFIHCAVTESFLSRIYACATIPQSKHIELQFSEAIKINDLGTRASNGRTAIRNSQTKTGSTEQERIQ
jgi:hypothetical protein